MNKKLLSVSDIAQILGVNGRIAYQMFHRRDFPAIKLGRRLFVRKDAFMNWLEKLEKIPV